MFAASLVHLFPLVMLLLLRKRLATHPASVRWSIAVCAWLLIPGTVTVLALTLGF
jgi:hypothetical protein